MGDLGQDKVVVLQQQVHRLSPTAMLFELVFLAIVILA
jgi:hypothetical protein